MKALLLMTTVLSSLNSMAFTPAVANEKVFEQCYNASYATDYVYENRFNVVVDATNIELEESAVSKFWTILKKSEIEVLSMSEGLEFGSSLDGKKSRFVIKVSLKDMQRARLLIDVLNEMSFVKVSCKYKI